MHQHLAKKSQKKEKGKKRKAIGKNKFYYLITKLIIIIK